jgi:uncharacterized membrane protein YhaH (DUF805 family)
MQAEWIADFPAAGFRAPLAFCGAVRIMAAPSRRGRTPVDFKQSVLRCVRDKYVDFNGRAGRPEFWWFALFCFLVAAAFGVLRLETLGMLANLALLLPSLAVGARRLHDTGKSGWFQLVWLVPLIGWAIMVYWLAQPSVGANEYGNGPAHAATPVLPPGAF